MENAVPEKQSPFATEPIGRLIVRFAVPSVIALLVNSLYNIVDQIFIGWGVGYLGNGATNIVFPITIVALALSMMIGNGGAAYLSLKLGEGKKEEARTGVGNAVSLVCVVSVVLAVVFLLWIDPILTLVRCHRRAAPLRPAVRLHYRPWAALYDDLRRHQLHDPRGRQPQVRHAVHGHRCHYQRDSGPGADFHFSHGGPGRSRGHRCGAGGILCGVGGLHAPVQDGAAA